MSALFFLVRYQNCCVHVDGHSTTLIAAYDKDCNLDDI